MILQVLFPNGPLRIVTNHIGENNVAWKGRRLLTLTGPPLCYRGHFHRRRLSTLIGSSANFREVQLTAVLCEHFSMLAGSG